MTSLAIVVGLWVVVGLAAVVSSLRRRANDAKRIERFQRALGINGERSERASSEPGELEGVPRVPVRGVTILGPRAHAKGASQARQAPEPPSSARPGADGEPGSDEESCRDNTIDAAEPRDPTPPPAGAVGGRRSSDAVPFPRARIPEGTRRHFGGAGRSRPRLAHLGRVAGEEPVELPAAAQLEAEAAKRAREAAASGTETRPSEPGAPSGASGDSGGAQAAGAPPAPPVTPATDDAGPREPTTAEGAPEERVGVHGGAPSSEDALAQAEAPEEALSVPYALPWLPDAEPSRAGTGLGQVAWISGRPRSRVAGHRHRPRRLALLGAIATVVVVAVGASVALSESSGGSTLASPRRAGTAGAGSARRSRVSKGSATSESGGRVPTTTTTTAPPKPTVVRPVSADAVEASYVIPSSPFVLTLTTSGPCWIDLVNRTTGAVLYTGTMTAGESKSFSGLDQIFLRAGRMKNLQITVDGIPVRSPNNGPGAYDLVFQVSSSSSGSTGSSSASAQSGTPA